MRDPEKAKKGDRDGRQKKKRDREKGKAGRKRQREEDKEIINIIVS